MQQFTQILSQCETAKEAFPFGFVVDRDMKIVEVGKSLNQIAPQAYEGAQANEVFEIERPNRLSWSAVSLIDSQNKLMLLRIVGGGTTLRTQCFPGNDCFAFETSPIITDPSTIAELGLTFSDFSLTDPITDNMFIWTMHQRMLREAETLTKELEASNDRLHSEVAIRLDEFRKLQQVKKEREALQEELLSASREAGKAEIATGVLHNVGNVMNSVNVSAGVLYDKLRQDVHSQLAAALQVLDANADNLPSFIASAQGQQLVPFLNRMKRQTAELMHEVDVLRENVEHVNAVVAAQQEFATLGGVKTKVQVHEIVEASIKIVNEMFRQHSVEVVCDYQQCPEVCVDKQKLVQVIVNLLSNAKNAIDDLPDADRRIQVSVFEESNEIHIQVADRGIGIAAENLNKIFRNGFTTRGDAGGHGFGLHHSHCTVVEMGGNLVASSQGLKQGAMFTVRFPSSASPASVDREGELSAQTM